MKYPIDFVLIWVDGNDPKWQNEKKLYDSNMNSNIYSVIKENNSQSRFRDWDILQYWFRAVEKYTPWVRKIHFVTWGHLPVWLNISHPKLNIVRHDQFIPNKYRPTFNSHTIELNIHYIADLSEHFVYFNDDMFIIKKMNPEEFFINGLPCESAILDAAAVTGVDTALAKIYNMGILNRNFSKKDIINKNFFKWFNLKYGLLIFKNILLYPFQYFTGIHELHLPSSFLKSTFKKIWNVEYDTLNSTCLSKFRGQNQVNQWVIENWQIASGDFVPRTAKIGRTFKIKDHIDDSCNVIKKQAYKMICLHDSEDIDNFNEAKEKLSDAFSSILPNKSGFEK